MTREEKHLWYDFLKRLPLTVKRQHNIENYIVDFYVAEKKLVIELDGMQHSEEDRARADAERDASLAKWGICVLRYANRDVKRNFEAVTADILSNLGLSFSDLKSG